MTRLTSRDYKKTQRNSLSSASLRGFGAGVLVGAVLASGIFLYLRGPAEPELEPIRPEPRATQPAEATAAAAVEETDRLDFYEMLPKFEVVVPEQEGDVWRDLPTAPIERPGVYVLQAGSYRQQTDAERVSAQLARQGLQARVQRVAIDNDVWHRVRIGPIENLDELNRLRRQLRAADIDALVIRVGD